MPKSGNSAKKPLGPFFNYARCFSRVVKEQSSFTHKKRSAFFVVFASVTAFVCDVKSLRDFTCVKSEINEVISHEQKSRYGVNVLDSFLKYIYPRTPIIAAANIIPRIPTLCILNIANALGPPPIESLSAVFSKS